MNSECMIFLFFVSWPFIHPLEHNYTGQPAQFYFFLNLSTTMLTSAFKCFKEVKIDKWPDLSYSSLPIDCCVQNKWWAWVYSVVIFSHRYLDSDHNHHIHVHVNVKTFVFLVVYWSIWTSSYNTDIKVQQFFNGASTMLNNVFDFNWLLFPQIWWIKNWCTMYM